MALELKNTEHSYYCSDNNYYVGGAENHGRCDCGGRKPQIIRKGLKNNQKRHL